MTPDRNSNERGSLRNGSRALRPVLITGGAGFIGTNVAASFLAEGRPVVILDNLSRPGVRQNLAWLIRSYAPLVAVIQADVRNAAAVQSAVEGAACVFHFAAQVAVTTSLLNPRSDFDVNLRGTLNVLEACRTCKSPPPLLFTSTNKVYGSLSELSLRRSPRRYDPVDPAIRRRGIDEHQPLEFHSPYGCSKGAADQYVLDYAKCFDLSAVVFRMSCIYGPHQHGTEDQGWAAHFVKQVLRGEPITIYGDGCQVRDMLFVDDLVRAMRSALEHIEDTQAKAFNVGGGPCNAVSVGEVADELRALADAEAPIQHSAWRRGDQRYYVSNVTRLSEATGWSPEVGVREGLSRLYEWLRTASHGRRPLAATARRFQVNGYHLERAPSAMPVATE